MTLQIQGEITVNMIKHEYSHITQSFQTFSAIFRGVLPMLAQLYLVHLELEDQSTVAPPQEQGKCPDCLEHFNTVVNGNGVQV